MSVAMVAIEHIEASPEDHQTPQTIERRGVASEHAATLFRAKRREHESEISRLLALTPIHQSLLLPLPPSFVRRKGRKQQETLVIVVNFRNLQPPLVDTGFNRDMQHVEDIQQKYHHPHHHNCSL